uniref:Uncharacterized protein n=1 Tax=Anopheles atroparvus TaxID=41427 RepID=A0AAG5D0U3_ANOAO
MAARTRKHCLCKRCCETFLHNDGWSLSSGKTGTRISHRSRKRERTSATRENKSCRTQGDPDRIIARRFGFAVHKICKAKKSAHPKNIHRSVRV